MQVTVNLTFRPFFCLFFFVAGSKSRPPGGAGRDLRHAGDERSSQRKGQGTF